MLSEQLLKDPEVKVVDFSIKEVTLSDISIDVKVNVKNPNAVALNLDQLSYDLSFSGEHVTEGTLKQGMKVPASGANDILVPVKFKYKSLGNLLSGLMGKGLSKEYELKGTAMLGIFSIPFSKKGEISLTSKK